MPRNGMSNSDSLSVAVDTSRRRELHPAKSETLLSYDLARLVNNLSE